MNIIKRKVDLDRGQRIKYVRRDLLDFRAQEDFAAALSSSTGRTFTRGAVGNWEQGKEIGLESLRAIAELADVSLDWLAYDNGPKPSKDGMPRSEKVADHAEIVAFLKRIDGLPESAIETILGVIEIAKKNQGGLKPSVDHDERQPETAPHAASPSRQR